MKTITIHRLLPLPPSLAVRGADGLPKRIPLGNFDRQYLSSQSMKAHWREMLQGAAGHGTLGQALLHTDRTVRSKRIGEKRIAPNLVAGGMSEADAKLWAGTVMALFKKEKEDKPENGNSAKKGKGKAKDVEPANDDVEEVVEAATPKAPKEKDATLVLGEREITALTILARAAAANGVEPAKLYAMVEKPTLLKAAPPPVQEAVSALKAMQQHVGFDGALFGRFVTGIALSHVDAAVHVGHSIGVHPIASAADFWSAQDQLSGPDEAGAGHINMREITTGVFYCTAVINLLQLRENLVGVNGDLLDDVTFEGVLAWLIESFGELVPAAMKGSTAPYCDVGAMLVEVSAKRPLNLFRAFERPCEATVDAAKQRLLAHADKVWRMHGRGDVYDLDDVAGTWEQPALKTFAATVARDVMQAPTLYQAAE